LQNPFIEVVLKMYHESAEHYIISKYSIFSWLY